MRQKNNKKSRRNAKRDYPSRVKSSGDYRGAHNTVGEDMRESRNEAETFQKEESEPTPFD